MTSQENTPAPRPAPCLAASPDSIARAARLIREGALVAIPTDTVYGLAADATSDDAVAAVFAAKGRPADKPLIALVADLATARACAALGDRAHALAEAFWPGPLTLVLPRRPNSPLSPMISAGARGVSLRIPGNETALAVIRATERPLTAPSANLSGEPSPLTAEAAAAGLGPALALALDGGPAADSHGSTLLDLTADPPRLLREGTLSPAAIARIIGPIDETR